VVDGHPHPQPVAEFLPQRQQRVGAFHHRPHGIGQHQHAIATGQRRPDHGDEVGVHERFTAGEADLRRVTAGIGLVQEPVDLRRRQVDQAVIGRAGFDVAVDAFQVAQGAGVEPQRRQPVQRHRGPLAAVCRREGVAELRRVDPRMGRVQRGIGHGHSRSARPRAAKALIRQHACPAISGRWSGRLPLSTHCPRRSRGGDGDVCQLPAPHEPASKRLMRHHHAYSIRSCETMQSP